MGAEFYGVMQGLAIASPLVVGSLLYAVGMLIGRKNNERGH
jgi:hypothetical protein